MRVGVGLPTTTPGADGALLVDWARKADAGPFSSLGVLDRLLYDSFDPFASLAAAAAVTERIRLATMIAIGPLRPAATLIKDAASVHALSGGRLTLGLAIGAREDDYEASRRPHQGPRRAALRPARRAARLGRLAGRAGHDPATAGRSCSSAARAAPRSRAWRATATAMPMAAARRAPSRAPRPRRSPPGATSAARADPRCGARPTSRSATRPPGEAYLLDYYAFTGPFAAKIAAGNLTSPRAIRDFVRAYEEAGCDELVLLPTVADLEQLERLAEVLA